MRDERAPRLRERAAPGALPAPSRRFRCVSWALRGLWLASLPPRSAWGGSGPTAARPSGTQGPRRASGEPGTLLPLPPFPSRGFHRSRHPCQSPRIFASAFRLFLQETNPEGIIPGRDRGAAGTRREGRAGSSAAPARTLRPPGLSAEGAAAWTPLRGPGCVEPAPRRPGHVCLALFPREPGPPQRPAGSAVMTLHPAAAA